MQIRSVAVGGDVHRRNAQKEGHKRGSMHSMLSIGSEDSLKATFSLAGKGQVTRKHVVDFIKREMTVRTSCKSLPFTFIFWFIFVLTSLAHRQVQLAYTIQSFTTSQLASVPVVYTVEPEPEDASVLNTSRRLKAGASGGSVSADASLAEVGVSLEDVKTLQGVYDWIDSTLITLAWTNANNGVSFINSFNRVVGGCRLQQRRLVRDECPGSSAMRDYFKPTCYSRSGKTNSSSVASWSANTDDTASNTYWLDIHQSQTLALAHTAYLRQSSWLSQATDRIRIQQVMFNDQVALFAFVEVMFELRRSGQLTANVLVKVVPTQVYNSAIAIIGDLLLVLLLSWLAIGELLSVCELCRDKRCRDYFSHFWHYKLLNWVLFWMGSGLVIFRAFMTTKLDGLDTKLKAVPDPPDTAYLPGSASWVARHDKLDILYSSMKTVVDYLDYSDVTTFWYMLVVVFKFFEAFGANPRLALITTTFYQATADLLHFLIIFLSIFLNFAVGAYVMFGGQIEEWSTPGLCITTSFRALMGDFNFGDMYDVAPVSACIWFTFFMFLIFIVMLNMLLAIIMDIYCDVKERCSSEMSLYEQLRLIYKGMKMRRGHMKDVLSKLESDQTETQVDLDTLRQLGVQDDVARQVIDRLHEEITSKYAKKHNMSEKEVAGEATSRWKDRVLANRKDKDEAKDDKEESDLRTAAQNKTNGLDEKTVTAEQSAKEAIERLKIFRGGAVKPAADPNPKLAALDPKGPQSQPPQLQASAESKRNDDNLKDIARSARELLRRMEKLNKDTPKTK